VRHDLTPASFLCLLYRHDSTIGAAFVTKDVPTEGSMVRLEMWVSAGVAWV
jgi:hypothetical protein